MKELHPTIAVISPHLDDAVLSCAQLLAASPGCGVITVFAGVPPLGSHVTEWDRAAGFLTSVQAMRARHAEDDRALACVGALPHRLPFLDAQYGEPCAIRQIADSLSECIGRWSPTRVLVPLGLFHSDHRLTSEAALQACAGISQLWAYEDALYRLLSGEVQARLFSLASAGWRATPVDAPSGPLQLKEQAIAHYVSQLRALRTPGRPGHRAALMPERYWQLDRPGSKRG